MVSTNLKTWGSKEYSTTIPNWFKFGLLFAALIGLGSDINHMRDDSLNFATTWFLIEVTLTYAAIGVSLLSAQISVTLCLLSMGAAFATQRPLFALIAACVIALVTSAACRITLTIFHCCATIIWAILVVFFVPVVDARSSEAFWWLTIWLITLAVLIGLAIKFLIIRASKIQAKLREAEARQEEIRREERRDLARELHDVVAHHITVITMQIMAHRKTRDPEQLHETLRTIDDSAREALVELRALLDVLRADEGGDPQLSSDRIVTGPTLQELVDKQVESLTTAGFQIRRASVDPRIDSLPFSLRTTCSRIVQESVTNIIKHARHGATCSLNVALSPTEVTITITNNRSKTKATDRPASTSYGLVGLRERATAVGGRYTAELRAEEWVVEAHIPVRDSGNGLNSSARKQRIPQLDLSHLEETKTPEPKEKN